MATITSAFREGVDDATSEIRCGAWTRERAAAYLAGVKPSASRSAELRDYSRGFDATLQAFADNVIDLGIVAVSARVGAL